MDRTLKIFVSCAFGAGIGALVALEVHQYFWWIGMLIGGLVGYLSYDFKAAIRAVPKAWHTTIVWRPSQETVSNTIVILALPAYYLQWVFLVMLLFFVLFPSSLSDGATLGLMMVLSFVFLVLNVAWIAYSLEQGSQFWNHVNSVVEEKPFWVFSYISMLFLFLFFIFPL